MSVIGTAGHVDHGKSALVRALTGIDPDRLQEEKDRGMTIDLGFAWLKLPSGREASIVDVPGHEGFIKNMLAGVGGIDLALLVIAADDGVMPQTMEHLAILNLLEVERGLVAITKKDLVDEEWLELVVSDVEETVKPTFLAGAPIVPVSSLTGDGLPELLAALDRLLGQIPPKRDVGRPRLPIDRVFTMSGFGTVVTGTLIDGRLAVGQEVEVMPGGLKARIRGLQAHRQKLEVGAPGARLAINLANAPAQDLARGLIISTPGWLAPTVVADVKLGLMGDAGASLTHGAGVMVHLLASQSAGRVRLLDRNELKPGETGWAQIRFAEPLAAVRGDRFIVRNAAGTVGGGQIVDPHPPRHRRFHQETLERLMAGEQDTRALVLQILEKQEPGELRDLLKNAALSSAEGRATIEQLIADGAIIALGDRELDERSLLISAVGWARAVARTEEALRAYHRQYPLRAGMPKEEMKSRLRFPPRATTEALDRMLRQGQLVDGCLVDDGHILRLAEHEVKPTLQHLAAADALLRTLASSPFSPPTDLTVDAEIVSWLADGGRIVRLVDDILFTAAAYEQLVAWTVEYIKTNGRVSHVELREKFDLSRRIGFAILEQLDQQRITRRVGNDRVLK